MQFGAPYMFHFFWCLPLMIVLLVAANRRYNSRIQKFIDHNLLPLVLHQFDSRERLQRLVLISLVLFFAIIAIARPQWGFEWQEVKRKGMDLLIIVDTSKSMLTQDVKPNRLERTKLAVEDLLKKLNGDRIGLIAFAGDAFLLCPLTIDYAGFQLSLDELNENSVPRGGTNIAAAIDEALAQYEEGSENYRAVIIVTDGDELEGDALVQAKKAADKGIKIYTIGIGTREGELIQIRDADNSNQFLKDANGNYVKSRLNEQLLQQVALTTGGVYIKSSGAQFGLDYIYEQELSKFEKREFDSQKEKRYYERFQFPLALAVFFLVWETCWGIHKKSRKKSGAVK